MHSKSPIPHTRLASDGLYPIHGLTLHELRAYYDAQPADSVDTVLAHLVLVLRNIHEHAQEVQDFIAAAKRGAGVAADAR